MEPVAIISVYPSNDRIINILNRCIHAYKSIGWDVIVTSHLPLDEQTTKNATYTIYDSDNTFLRHDLCPVFWNECAGTKITIPTCGHVLPICRNIKLGITMAKALGYTHFVFTEADVLLGGSDLQLLESYIKTLDTEDKKMLFFRPEEYRGINGSYVYESLMFGGNVNYFVDNFTPPLSSEDWINFNFGHTLELSFYEKLSHDEDKFLIINDHSSNIFKASEVNVLRFGFFNCEMVYNTPDPSKVALYIMNYLVGEEQIKYVSIYKNNTIFTNIILHKHGYWFVDFDIDETEVVVEVYSDERKTILETSKKYVLNKQLRDTAHERGVFEYIN